MKADSENEYSEQARNENNLIGGGKLWLRQNELFIIENEADQIICGKRIRAKRVQVVDWTTNRLGHCACDSARFGDDLDRLLACRQLTTLGERDVAVARLCRRQHNLIVAARLLHCADVGRYRAVAEGEGRDTVLEQVALIVESAESPLPDLFSQNTREGSCILQMNMGLLIAK